MKKTIFIVAALALMASPALASDHGEEHGSTNFDSDTVVVGNINAGFVMNNVGVGANSGANGAIGNSGDVTIRTGDATAIAWTDNTVNSNLNEVTIGCDTCGENSGSRGHHGSSVDTDLTMVGNVNLGAVINNVGVGANTGLNGATENGGEFNLEAVHNENSSSCGRGGHHSWNEHKWFELSFPMGGDVSITTGDAGARAETVNVVNTNINRVTIGGAPVVPDPI